MYMLHDCTDLYIQVTDGVYNEVHVFPVYIVLHANVYPLSKLEQFFLLN